MSTRATTRPSFAKFVKPGTAIDDRRRRPRLESEAVGYVLCETACTRGEDECEEPREVLVQDVSRLGVGFVTAEKMEVGTVCRIRIGYGPMRLARRMRVARCESQFDRSWRIGAEFA